MAVQVRLNYVEPPVPEMTLEEVKPELTEKEAKGKKKR
jgi:hypothetical protein